MAKRKKKSVQEDAERPRGGCEWCGGSGKQPVGGTLKYCICKLGQELKNLRNECN